MSDFSFTPVVILGAGRSGTNALRDAITGLPGFETWPCDEINPIWRHGNISWPDDEIPPSQANGPKGSIRRSFQRIWRSSNKPAFVVEKTCANTLRVPFVDAVIPEAKYIHIIRDGVDVVASAQKRWRGEMELASLPYYWAKIKYAPKTDLPRYGLSFIKNRIAMAKSAEKRMDIWGPRFKGMDEMSRNGADLDAICATQWVRCIEATESALATMPKEKSLTLRYEDFTGQPSAALAKILSFLGHASASSTEINQAVADVSTHSIRKGRKALSGDIDALLEIMRPTLLRLGYEG